MLLDKSHCFISILLLLNQMLRSHYGDINDIFMAFFCLQLSGCSLQLVNYTRSPFPHSANTLLPHPAALGPKTKPAPPAFVAHTRPGSSAFCSTGLLKPSPAPRLKKKGPGTTSTPAQQRLEEASTTGCPAAAGQRPPAKNLTENKPCTASHGTPPAPSGLKTRPGFLFD